MDDEQLTSQRGPPTHWGLLACTIGNAWHLLQSVPAPHTWQVYWKQGGGPFKSHPGVHTAKWEGVTWKGSSGDGKANCEGKEGWLYVITARRTCPVVTVPGHDHRAEQTLRNDSLQRESQ